MRKLTVKIWLTIAAFFLSATVSVADCSSNANQCTPKQLCSAATSTEGGVKVWSKSSYYSKHVSKAKQVGINCGVVEIVASCDNDPELCSVDDLCKQSVQKSGGKTGWKTSSRAAGYIALAKEFGLKCGVTEPLELSQKICLEDVTACSKAQLCAQERFYSNGQYYQKNKTTRLKHLTEAKRRDLTCGVNETVSKKNTCSENTAKCVRYLCNRSTYYKSGVKVWNLKSKYSTEAKRRGLTCGVTETVAKKKTCSQDVKVCNSTQLCRSATVISGGKNAWNENYFKKHVTEAKRRGLDCGVQDSRTLAKNTSNVNLCKLATYFNFQGKRIWNRSSQHAIAEAKRRGLTCGVGTKITIASSSASGKKKTCDEDVEACSASVLCINARSYDLGTYSWESDSRFKKFVFEAKRRGLSCGVGNSGTTTASNTSSYTNTTILKNAFRGESVLRRKQIQYALKKLNYYTSSIDALYGPGTERALTGYANAKVLNGRSPNSIFSSVLSQVSVPSSFAVAKRSNNSSSSSSSSSSGGSSAGRTLLQGLFVAGACSLTSNPGACLDGATG
ncbi:peptidoglycan-binding protein, partial [Rhodobacteraceae bacterium]|nr:peptidoglycan-binding protein [Paracoccaceae bacterium]